MKRVFSFLASVIAVLIILSSCITCFAAQLGDVNNDGKCSLIDAKLVLKSNAGLIEFDNIQARLGDINNDGKVSIADAKFILQIVAGIKEAPTTAVYPELEEMISAAQAIDLTQLKDGSAYTEKSSAELVTAIANAQAVCNNPASTKTEAEESAKKLETAVSNLRTYKELLKNHIKAAQNVYKEELLAGSPDLKSEINRVALIYKDASSTDEDYIKAMDDLSIAVREFTDYYIKHTNEGVIEW